ncbi:MAG: response regulator transcription factor [Caldilineaceae bacterium]|nr:response regulator transcription factor [Caldilineaceae bacterium]
METRIRVMLVDDHPPFRIGMRVLLEQHHQIQVVAEADTGRAALEQLAACAPTVVVLDCQLPDSDGPTVAQAIQQRLPTVRLLALSAYDDLKYIRGLLAAGALGYLLKNEAPETIVAAVQAVTQGQSYFSATVAAQFAQLARRDEPLLAPPTAREQEVLQALAKGLTNAQIAHSLGIAERTVRFHVENLFSRLQVDNRVEAVMKALRLGWLDKT